ncbi:MAG TPA: F0F1 ATP synthase subunit delta [Bacillota bacterium]|nr:F0F1 ATP synthase subunit delta [Bacillota bacterium]
MHTTKQTRREARHLLRLCSTNGLLDEDRAQQLLQRILQAKPRGCLRVLTHFQRLVKLDRAEHTAKVETAIPLPPDLAGTVQARLERLYGPGLNISFAHSPELIGGMRITVGSDVYDGSIQARLAALEERL